MTSKGVKEVGQQKMTTVTGSTKKTFREAVIQQPSTSTKGKLKRKVKGFWDEAMDMADTRKWKMREEEESSEEEDKRKQAKDDENQSENKPNSEMQVEPNLDSRGHSEKEKSKKLTTREHTEDAEEEDIVGYVRSGVQRFRKK